MIVGDAESELERVDLRGAELNDLNLSKVCFAHSNLDGAILRGADLSHAQLRDTRLAGVIADNTTKWPHGFTPPPSRT
jgi:uncharacterized protein YjbI with pentapeptide repeats